jgi:hypothetical protein
MSFVFFKNFQFESTVSVKTPKSPKGDFKASHLGEVVTFDTASLSIRQKKHLFIENPKLCIDDYSTLS